MALLVLTGIAVTTEKAAAAITDPFTQRFGINANGAVMLRGNANLYCPAATAGCTDGRNGTATGGFGESLNNNGYNMVHNDTDGDPLTFNHSSATVTLPAGATVLYAALYWSADTAAGTNGVAATTPADKGKVLLGTPAGGAWHTIGSDKVFASGSVTAYQAVADVTTLVSGAGSGTYRVANIQAGTGRDRYAGWALAIAYHDDAQRMRSLRIYDGFGVVSSSSASLTINISGFQTPQAGPVDADIGTVVYEGDLGKTGDSLKLNSVSMGDALNPSDNFFNSTVSEAAAAVSGRSPSGPNLMGVDIDQFNANNQLAPNATSADLTLTTMGETFYPGVVTFATDLFAPKLVTTTTATDQDLGDLLPGDVIEYRVEVRNDGTDTASNSTLINAVPSGTTFVPGSITVAGTPSSDSPYSPAKLTVNLGTLAYQASTYVTFRVRVDDDTPPHAGIVNIPNLSYQGSTSSLVITGIGDTDTRTVQQPDTDLRAAVTVAPAAVQRAVASNPVSYLVSVTNDGPNLEPEPTAVLDLPAGVTPGTPPTGCVAAGQRVTCTLAALASGSTGTVTIPAVAGSSAATTATAGVTASGVGADPDTSDNTGTADLRVNDAPQPVNETVTAAAGTPLEVRVRDNDSDPDDARGTLTVSVTSGPQHGSTVVNADQTVTYTPDPGWRGDDTFTYTLTDPYQGTGTATVTVRTANAGPVANDDSVATARGNPVTLTVTTNDTDPNNDPRTVTAVTQPAGGTGTVTVSGNDVTYTPPSPAYQGTAQFTYTISDGQGGTATGTVRVTVGNSAPVAADDTGTVSYLGTVPVDVLGNDTDPDGDTLTIATVGVPDHGTADIVSGRIRYTGPAGFSGDATFTYTISDGTGGTATGRVVVTVGNGPPAAADKTATTPFATVARVNALTGSTDPNGDARRVLSTTTPANGTVVLEPGGVLVYTPGPRFSGVDRFDYTLTDDNGGTATARITVTVANGVPAARDDTVTATAGAPTTIEVTANDTDPNGDPLTITVDVPPAHGTTRVSGGRVIYTPAPGWSGPDSFHYTVSDGNGGTAGATVAVTVLNVAPVARADSVATDAAVPVTVAVLANDTDPNGDPLTLSASSTPAHGTVTQDADGSLVYRPAAGFVGIDAFTYTVTDPGGLSSTTTVTVTVHNAPPIAVDDRFAVPPGTATTLAVLGNDIDPNTGQTLTVTSVGEAAKGTVRLVAGKVVYTPAPGATGTDTFTYEIGDEYGATDQATVTVVIDVPPAAGPDTATTPAGTAVDIDVTANDTDPERGGLTIVTPGTPAHGTARVVDGRIRYTPEAGFSGKETFEYTVRDAAGHTVTATVTVTVTPAAVVPAAPGKTVRGKPGTPLVITMPTADDSGSKIRITSTGTPEHGTARLNSDGTVTYTPDPGFRGTDTFTYSAVNAKGQLVQGVITVTVAGGNRPPSATGNRYSVASGSSIVVRPALDDTDPDHDRITVVLVGKAGHGTAVVDAQGRVTYAPDDGFAGTDSFTYKIDDGKGGTDTATVTMTVLAADDLALTGDDIISTVHTGVVILLIGGILCTAGLHGMVTPGRHRPGRHRG